MEQAIKVVQLSSVHACFDTRIFYKISTSLAKAGYDVDLIIQHTKDEQINGINIKSLPIAERKLDRPLKIIPRLLFKAIKYPRGTIFHFHDPELIPVGFILKLLGHKVIYDVHEDVPMDILTKEWIPVYSRKTISKIIEFLEQTIGRAFDSILTVVPSITSRFEKKALEIRNYPIVESTIISQSLKKDYIVYIGSLTERRGLVNMIKAIDITEERVNFKIGGTFGDKAFQNKLKALANKKDVDFLGWVNQSQLISLLENARVGILTLKQIPSHLVSLPVKLFEYMRHGLPVIASDFPLWREIILENNCGILVDPESPQEIAKAIDWIFQHPEEAKKMGENGRKAVLEKYNWAKEEEKLLKLYSNLS